MRKKIFILILLTPFYGLAQKSPFQLIGSISDTFDVATSTWLSTDSAQFLYNSDTLLVTWNQLINDPDTGWVSNRTSFYSYDEFENDTSEVIQQYDDYTAYFVNQTKLVKSYSAEKQLLNTVVQLWDLSNQTWFNSTLISNAYDGNANLKQQVYFAWNALTSSWDSIQKFLYDYDANNNRITETISGGYQVLFNQSQTSFYYNSANLDTLRVRLIWNNSNSSWKKKDGFLDTLAYDANKNLISSTRWNYNNSSQKYDKSSSKIEYEYTADNFVQIRHDYNGDGASLFIPTADYYYQYDENGNRDTLTVKIYEAGSGSFVNFQQQRFYYTSVDSLTTISGVPDNAYRFNLFPNPAQETIQMIATQALPSNNLLLIYNQKGEMIYQYTYSLGKGENIISLNTASLPPGIYFIKTINTENNTQSINRFVKL